RTFLAIGAVEEARYEAQRTIQALAPLPARGLPVIGLEPSCVFGFRDEIPALIQTPAAKLLAVQTLMLDEFLASEHTAGRLELQLPHSKRHALLHGHCHQKAFGALPATE